MTLKSAYNFSERGLNPLQAIDFNSLDIRARFRLDSRAVVVGSTEAATAYFVINSTKKHSLGPLGLGPALLTGAIISTRVVPVGGSLTCKLVAYDASADAEIVLTDAFDIETITAREGGSLVIATTNVALDAADTIELHCISDNNTVTTDANALKVTMYWNPSQPTDQAYRYTP